MKNVRNELLLEDNQISDWLKKKQWIIETEIDFSDRINWMKKEIS